MFRILCEAVRIIGLGIFIIASALLEMCFYFVRWMAGRE